jgi:hypothetical protein
MIEQTSVSDWAESMSGIPNIEVTFDNVKCKTYGAVTSVYFENVSEKKKKADLQNELLETLAKSGQQLKYAVMGRNDAYQEIGYTSKRSFGNILEAIEYGKKLVIEYPYSYHSFIIQALFENSTASFNLSAVQINMIYDIENKSS